MMTRNGVTRRQTLGALSGAALLGAPTPAFGQAKPIAHTVTLDSSGVNAAAAHASSLDQLNSLIIAHHGEIVFMEAFRGPALTRTVNVKSVSKTLVASLVGAALDRGILRDVTQLIAEFFPEEIERGADPRVQRIMLAHLLTMKAGLERMSGPNYGRWIASDDWIRYALNRPFMDEPGGAMLYSTASTHLLGVILARATGRSLLQLAREWLGGPLGIEIPPWTRDPQGYYLGGNEMAVTPLGLLRFGEMARMGGVWDGQRVLSQSWLEASWTPRTRSPFSGHEYGYGWFLTEAHGHRIAYARGYGGQMVYVAPSAGLTVVITSDPTRPARAGPYIDALNGLLMDDILPAIG